MLRGCSPWFVAALVLAALPLAFDSPAALAVLNQMGIAVVFALSYNLLLGQGGMLSFGHAVYFGLGGFMAVHFLNVIAAQALPLPLALVPLIGACSGLAFAILIGSFSTRRAGTAFAMISLGLGELVAACSLIFVAFFGGEEGISADRTAAAPLFGHDFARDSEVYYLIAAWAFGAALLMYLFSRTPAGVMAQAVRDNAERAEFIGYSQQGVRFISFCASGFFAGIAGGLFAINYEIVTEENLSLITSGNVLLMTYIGGVGYFIGPVVGAIVLTLLQTVLSRYTEIWQLYVGILFIATVLYVPAGLSGILMLHAPAWRMRRLRYLLVPYIKTGVPAALLLAGGVGLLELLHHARTAPGAGALWPWWLLLAGLSGAGAWALKKTLPALRTAWALANQAP